ncbi:MAG: polysaccharide biosynthesis protein [Gammaproteobacteria bacterium]
MFKDKSILITGGTGSLGKILVKRILSGDLGAPKKVIVLSRDEAKQHNMRLAFLHRKITTDEVIYNNFINTLEFRIGDVRNYEDVCSAIKSVDIVINAAALKQVPTCEYFPEQAIYTNCQGAINIVRAIREHDFNVSTVVGISTDKAAKPINVMGMSKALQERIFISANILNPQTRFVCVRYGNVLASRGSVIPLFHEQIIKGGPITITQPEMTRFLLSINEAVDTVFAAINEAKRGDIFIPNAPSATVINVAKALIEDRKIPISMIGIRPGEKLHEILISDEERYYTRTCGKYFAIASMLPELHDSLEENPPILDKEFSSQDNVLSLTQTHELLSQHHLLINQAKIDYHHEIVA